MYKDERDVFYYDAVTSVSHRVHSGLPAYPHFKIAKALAHLAKNGAAEVINKTGGAFQARYITQIDVYTDRCEILIGFSDTNAADPTFNDHPAKKRRFVAKVGNEGLEHSAHIVWYYENQQNNGACAFYLEGAVGLSSTAVARFVNRLIRSFCKTYPLHFVLPDPSGAQSGGKPKMISARPRFELRGHPSAEFIRDLAAGEISELELITESNAAKVWDSHGYSVEQHRGVLLKPTTQKHVPAAKKFVDGVLTAVVKQDFEKSRVVFKTSGDIRKDVKFYTQNYQLVNDNRYVKKSRIKGFGGKLSTAFDSINLPIIRDIRTIATGGKKALMKKPITI